MTTTLKTNLKGLSHPRYLEYPEFCQRLDELRDARWSEMQKMFNKYKRLADLKIYPNPDYEALTAARACESDAIDATYQKLIEQAHEEFQVPHLQFWSDAIGTPGGTANYHDEHPDRSITKRATIRQTTDGLLIAEIHTTLTCTIDQAKEFESMLQYYGGYLSAFEAVTDEEEHKG
jgi:hypothetical protein